MTREQITRIARNTAELIGAGEMVAKVSAAVAARRSSDFLIIARTDAPTCPECGSIMIPNGSCHKCVNCGTTSGCS